MYICSSYVVNDKLKVTMVLITHYFQGRKTGRGNWWFKSYASKDNYIKAPQTYKMSISKGRLPIKV